jgi:hypothetical protein
MCSSKTTGWSAPGKEGGAASSAPAASGAGVAEAGRPAVVQPQVRAERRADESSPGCVASTTARDTHSRYETNAARNSASAGNPTSLALRSNSVTARRRCSSVIATPGRLGARETASSAAGPPNASPSQAAARCGRSGGISAKMGARSSSSGACLSRKRRTRRVRAGRPPAHSNRVGRPGAADPGTRRTSGGPNRRACSGTARNDRGCSARGRRPGHALRRRRSRR